MRQDRLLHPDPLPIGPMPASDVRLALRVVYQALWGNLPLPDEAHCPLWMGRPAGSPLPRDERARRASVCLGLSVPAADRTAEQARKLATVLSVTRIPERAVLSYLAWGVYGFRDVGQKRTRLRNGSGHIGARYRGSPDDARLNASVARDAADPDAVAAFGRDADPDGRIGVPVLTVHAIDDPIARVDFATRTPADRSRT